jgi:predicted GIY-YIG superfamily endonuclease
MPQKRDTVTYELKQGRKVVYVGTTNDPTVREQQHKNSGKSFTHMRVTSRRMTADGAQKQESDRLSKYRDSHGGRNPRYNKDSDG